MENTTARPIRVIQYGVGSVGSAVVRLMLTKPQVQVVGAVETDEAKIGRDLGRVAALQRDTGITVSRTLASALAMSAADAVILSTYATLPEVMDQLSECIRAGLPVISTCEELAYPYRRYPELAAELNKLAQEHGVPIVGVQVNPGFAMDKLVLTFATACHDVSRVRVRRVVDASRRRLILQRRAGAGLSPAAFQEQLENDKIGVRGLEMSVAMLADSLGIAIDNIDETIEPLLATEKVYSQFIEVAPGQVKGVRQIARGTLSSAEVVRLDFEMFFGAQQSVDEMWISGKPDLHVVVPGGIHGDLATSAIVVNCLPAILRAEPGLRTARDLPMIFMAPAQMSSKAGA